MTGALVMGYSLVRQTMRAEQGQNAGNMLPKIRKAARVSGRMIGRPDVILTARQQKRKLAGIDHDLLRGGLTRHVFGPFCCASWSGQDKLDRLVDHFETVRDLGGILSPAHDHVRILCTLDSLGADYSLRIDEANWMSSDGLTVLSLWKGADRLFSITFLFSSANGGLTCLVGGLQGRGGEEMLTLYREMTKEAHGLRPRDLMIELHRMVCYALGVRRIYAVADSARYCRDAYYGAEGRSVTSFNYDAAWIDRGGAQISADWFELPIAPVRRAAEDIPAKKRSLYRQRYEMLDRLADEVRTAVEAAIPAPPVPTLIARLMDSAFPASASWAPPAMAPIAYSDAVSLDKSTN
ncbi:DUF535 family protein [Sphingobium nicotianae]|uniref:DUF535 family protein n=1 Tax=Sphingobium nicotianae TaxID=2782607 RepID=UPI001BE46774